MFYHRKKPKKYPQIKINPQRAHTRLNPNLKQRQRECVLLEPRLVSSRPLSLGRDVHRSRIGLYDL